MRRPPIFRLFTASAIAIALCGCASAPAPEPEYVPPSPPPPAYVPPPPPEPVPPPPPDPWRAEPPLATVAPPATGGGSTRPARPPRQPYSAPGRALEMRVGSAPYASPAPAPGCERSDLDCNEAVFGRGSFAKPPEMWVGKPANLKFAVGRTDEGVGRELAPSDQPAGAVKVSIGRCMKVTLEDDPRYDILGRNGETKRLARDMDRASWTWSVVPKQAGRTEFRARVEVLRIEGGRCTAEPIDEYTERVEVTVQIGLGRKLKGAVGEATETGGMFANLFKSWEGALAALAALLAALAGVIVAVRNLSPKGRERRATKKAERAQRPPRRKAKP